MVKLTICLISISGCSLRRRSTFSTITIASSTTIPIARIKANKLIVLSEYPNTAKHASVPKIDTGMVHTATKLARQFCKKINNTRATKKKAITMVSSTLLTEASTNRELSCVMRYFSPVGKCSASFAKSAKTCFLAAS